MSESNTKKHLKTYEEAILELGSFIQKTKAEEAQRAQEAAQKQEDTNNK